MGFDQVKDGILSRKDHSKKGEVDIGIKGLVEAINSIPLLCTTSSCAGRIMVIERKTERKIDARCLLVSHEPVVSDTVWGALQEAEYETFFRMEPIIVHITAADLEIAEALLRAARVAGLKRSGIMTFNPRIQLEVVGTDFLDTIVHDGKRLLITKDYCDALVYSANNKLERNHKRIVLFQKSVQDI